MQEHRIASRHDGFLDFFGGGGGGKIIGYKIVFLNPKQASSPLYTSSHMSEQEHSAQMSCKMLCKNDYGDTQKHLTLLNVQATPEPE